MTTVFNNVTLNIPDTKDYPQIPSSLSSMVPLNGERLDNVAFVVYGSHLEYPTVMRKNNVGFMFDVPSNKKIAIW